MGHAAFVHLRVHSAYSLSEGAIPVKTLIKLCVTGRMPAVAITDSGNLFGALEFALAAAEAGVQPIIGCQMGLTAIHAGSRASGGAGAAGAAGAAGGGAGGRSVAPPDPLVLLVQNETGYRNLMALVSQSYLKGEPGAAPQIALEGLAGRTDGLIALTGGPMGAIGRLLREGQAALAEAALRRLTELFPGRLYVELMRHGGHFRSLEQAVEPALIELAYALNLPLVATNDAYFPDAAMYEAHDALLCIAEGTYIAEENRRRLTPDHSFKPASAMAALFADLPEAVENTLVIARRCSFLLRPVNPILPAFPGIEGRTEEEELRAQARAGLEIRLRNQVLPAAPATATEELRTRYFERLEFELDVIVRMKFPGYFLIVSDFIKWSKAHAIPVGPGRGSGAGSVVAWALTITDLDPIRFGLLFERFLNPERVSMPDFDIDFCQERRDEVIRYVQDKYGFDRVAQIITFGKLQARAVLRDVGRVLQMPYTQVDRICKLVPNNPANPVTLKDAIAGEPLLREMVRDDPQVERLATIAQQLEGLYRHASTHAAGVVIGDRPLDTLVPLYRDPRSDMPVTQFNMKYVEQAGLVKFDFLGLKTLTVLQTAADLAGAGLDLAALPLDDPKTYALLGRAESTGVFQLESSGMRDVLRRLKPNRLEDIIALVALYRPGPMDNIPKYISVKNGQEPPDYLHPSLESILTETFGIMIYQEQVMQIAQVLAGYTLGGADLLRRAMGKKNQAEMDAQRRGFIEGAAARGVEPGQAGMIFDQVNKFAGYGFNKSHAAAYALVAYQTAWLKANHPVAFMAASMTLDLGNTDKLNVFRQELVRLEIRLLPPDINRSGAIFTVETLDDGRQGIRYALAAIKGVGMPAMNAVVAEREANGPFRDLFDLASRLDVKVINRRQLEGLAAAGAFESLNPNRAQVFAAIDTLIRHAHSATQERQSGQSNLFGMLSGAGAQSGSAPVETRPPLPVVSPWDPLETLRREFEAIGFYLSAHPLDAFTAPLKRLKVVRAADLAAQANRGGHTRFTMAGIVSGKRIATSKTGKKYAFVTLSDMSGQFEVTVFSEVLASAREFLEAGQAVVLNVDVQKNGEELRLTAQDVQPLEQAVSKVALGLQIFLARLDGVAPLKGTLERIGPGRGKISVMVDIGNFREAEVHLPGTYALSSKTRAALKAVPGVEEIRDV